MKGDFTGFSFDGIHSSELGIVRVSTSDRYQEVILPEIKDLSTELIGLNGEYFYGSTYGPREFEVSIAFDSMTEVQFRNIRRLFGQTKICRLIFDERPYKVYLAKIKDPIELEYVCFDEPFKIEGASRDGVRVASREEDGETGEITIEREQVTPWEYDYTRKQRIYKGEGKIEFICYFPFAKQLYKTLESYDPYFSNKDEWKESSRIMTADERNVYNIDSIIHHQDPSAPYVYTIPVYNPGDLNVGFNLYIPFGEDTTISPKEGNDYIIINSDQTYLFLREITKKGNDEGIIINTTNHLIEGVYFDTITQTYKRTKNLYNEYIYKGDFPYIKRDDWILDTFHQSQSVNISCAEKSGIEIFYDYLYF